MRIPLAVSLLLAGLLLFIAAGILYVTARHTQSEQQAALDQQWNAEEMHYAQLTPRILPPARPDPVPLPHRILILTLAAAGSALLTCGALTLIFALRPARTPRS